MLTSIRVRVAGFVRGGENTRGVRNGEGKKTKRSQELKRESTIVVRKGRGQSRSPHCKMPVPLLLRNYKE